MSEHNKDIRIIAFVGLAGSGKTSAVEYLTAKNYPKVYFGGIIYKAMEEAGIEVTWESQQVFREEIREREGKDFVVKRVAGTGLPSAGLALRPAKLTFPGLADNTLDLRIHGTDGESSDFTLTTAGDFGAAVTLRGGMTLSDPFNNKPLLTLEGPTAPITGSLSRTDDVVEISFILPTGFSS